MPEASVVSVRFSELGPPVRLTLAPGSGRFVTASITCRLTWTQSEPADGGADADETNVVFLDSCLPSLLRVIVRTTFL